MSRDVAAALLNQPAITALVAGRRSLNELPPTSALPALVYSIIDVDPTAYVDEASGYEVMRLQVNPLGSTTTIVDQVHAAVRQALDGLGQVSLGGVRIISVRRDLAGSYDSATNDAGTVVWTRPRDYIVVYE